MSTALVTLSFIFTFTFTIYILRHLFFFMHFSMFMCCPSSSSCTKHLYLFVVKNTSSLRKRFLCCFFSENFVAIHEIKPVLTLEKPIFVGFSVLDLSKLSMHELHCKYIKTKFNANLLFTDTGSLVDEVKTDDVYKDFYGHKNLFDFSDYPQDSKFFDLINEKVTANMKDSKQKLLMNLLD